MEKNFKVDLYDMEDLACPLGCVVSFFRDANNAIKQMKRFKIKLSYRNFPALNRLQFNLPNFQEKICLLPLDWVPFFAMLIISTRFISITEHKTECLLMYFNGSGRSVLWRHGDSVAVYLYFVGREFFVFKL